MNQSYLWELRGRSTLEAIKGCSSWGLIARTAHQGESRGPRGWGACQCKTCRSWLGIEKDWTKEQFEALQVCVVFGSFTACQDTTVSLRPDFIRWHAFPYVSWNVVEPPVRAGCVVLKCEHGEVGVGTMVQAG